jgi:hypothetical protein
MVETDNFIEKHYPYPYVTALGTEPPPFSGTDIEVNCIQYGSTVFPFRNSSFDVWWSVLS